MESIKLSQDIDLFKQSLYGTLGFENIIPESLRIHCVSRRQRPHSRTGYQRIVHNTSTANSQVVTVEHHTLPSKSTSTDSAE